MHLDLENTFDSLPRNNVSINGCALFPPLLAISFLNMLYKNIQVRDCRIVCVTLEERLANLLNLLTDVKV